MPSKFAAKCNDLISVTRPLNILLTVLSVWIGFIYSFDSFFSPQLIYAAASAGFICAAGNIFNDFFDKSVDQINKPDRPYAAGKLQAVDMLVSGIFAYSSGILLSFFVGIEGFLIVLSTSVLLMVYNVKAKRMVLAGNVIISLLAGMAFLYGGLAGGSIKNAAIPALFAVVFHFGREIFKDIEDKDADKKSGIDTFPVRYGEGKALVLGISVFILLIFLTPMPYVFLNYSLLYLITVAVGVDLLLIVLIQRYLVSRRMEHLKRLNKLMKFGMVFGLLALMFK